MINNIFKIRRKNGLHIKSHPQDPIEKPFSKTHAPVFGIRVPEKFYSSRIHRNPKQTTPILPQGNLRLGQSQQSIREDLDCPHWCERKTLHLGGLYFKLIAYNHNLTENNY